MSFRLMEGTKIPVRNRMCSVALRRMRLAAEDLTWLYKPSTVAVGGSTVRGEGRGWHGTSQTRTHTFSPLSMVHVPFHV